MNVRGYYAGIGPRSTPPAECYRMTRVARNLCKRGWALRSGGAKGADSAFKLGADRLTSQIFGPQTATEAAIELASKYHPNWKACDDYVRSLMGRNAQILLGLELNDPVKFVVTWTGDRYKGGTGMGLRLADAYGIKVFNLYNPLALEELKRYSL